MHFGSWRRNPDGSSLTYRQAADQLVPYVLEQGFTHVEFLPLTEYPLDESWGYQAVGYFAPTSRYGSPDDLRYLIDACHRAGLGVILDWVPGHFPRDSHGLADFDGTPLFEYGDPQKGSQPDWGTLVFNFDRQEVRSFLLSSARFWLEEFHVDGLRVDAVASMLYLDYSRKPGEWSPNIHGGNENLEAVHFLRELNTMTHRDFPGTVTIAEESTAWPGVSRPVETGGLGFSMKWNMGWMHDTLKYLALDPVHRKHHHDLLTFGPLYAFSENFVLPLSHDEVVHLKGSLLAQDAGRRLAAFRQPAAGLCLPVDLPGPQAAVHGRRTGPALGMEPSRIARPGTCWTTPATAACSGWCGDLNGLYAGTAALHRLDFDGRGFQWLRWDDADNSTLSFLRRADDDLAVVALNFTPVPRRATAWACPEPGEWREALNSDSRFYGGSDLGNAGVLHAEPVPCMHQPWSIVVTLPPLAGLVLARRSRTGGLKPSASGPVRRGATGAGARAPPGPGSAGRRTRAAAARRGSDARRPRSAGPAGAKSWTKTCSSPTGRSPDSLPPRSAYCRTGTVRSEHSSRDTTHSSRTSSGDRPFSATSTSRVTLSLKSIRLPTVFDQAQRRRRARQRAPAASSAARSRATA